MPKTPGPLRQNHPLIRQIAAAIVDSGMRQEDVAKRAGTSQAFVSNIRTGRNDVSFNMLEAVANTVGLEFKLERKHNGTE